MPSSANILLGVVIESRGRRASMESATRPGEVATPSQGARLPVGRPAGQLLADRAMQARCRCLRAMDIPYELPRSNCT